MREQGEELPLFFCHAVSHRHTTMLRRPTSWNRNLTLHRARAMGGEFRKKGVNVLLGPSVGPVGRVVRGGRNWESFSVDPYLAGALTSETIRGVQGAGVITSTKVRLSS